MKRRPWDGLAVGKGVGLGDAVPQGSDAERTAWQAMPRSRQEQVNGARQPGQGHRRVRAHANDGSVLVPLKFCAAARNVTPDATPVYPSKEGVQLNTSMGGYAEGSVRPNAREDAIERPWTWWWLMNSGGSGEQETVKRHSPQWWPYLPRPAMHGGVIDDHATLGHHLLQVAQAQRVRCVTAHAHQHDLQRVVQALEHLVQRRGHHLSFERTHSTFSLDRSAFAHSRRYCDRTRSAADLCWAWNATMPDSRSYRAWPHTKSAIATEPYERIPGSRITLTPDCARATFSLRRARTGHRSARPLARSAPTANRRTRAYTSRAAGATRHPARH
jgi:hypothetical protein